jgi:hypothetical protein
MPIVNERHLQAVLREYCKHYNDERPHQSCDLRPPGSSGDPAASIGAHVERHTRLGGLLSDYQRVPTAA